MNRGKDVKFGHDKRQVSIVPNSRENLFNISNGELLTDEFGFPIFSEVDTFYLPDSSTERSTSVVFANKESGYIRIEEVSVAKTTATFSGANNNIGITTIGSSYSLEVGDIIVGSSVPDATIISRVGVGSIYVSNFATNVGVKTEVVEIRRKIDLQAKYNPVLKIAEQFKEQSETSTTLLGINREEVQLSLFSNVSSYGLDNDDWEYYTYVSGPRNFGSWDRRYNLIYGNRYNARITEEVQESGIQLTSFPIPYSFPFGPNFEKYGYYNQTFFEQYESFIQLGNDLYDYFNGDEGISYPSDWKDKFLSRAFAYVAPADVEYSEDLDTSFSKIDNWTETWRDIVDNQLKDPVTNETFNFSRIAQIFPEENYSRDTTRPGYVSNYTRYATLQSRKSFRYQPGRISGFTFGLRASVETNPGYNIEWGCSNSTDEYVFRINAGQFSIVRRSTLPLGKEILERNGLSANDEVFGPSGEPFNSTDYYTTVIPRDNFNGDKLDGNGPSGYILKPENVTMYKIEFGWYGAIGARFYAYIPADNGEARWVVIHTLVIENSLGYPCLANSNFKFKYSLNVSSALRIRNPVYLYKYGASYYIDGGDEGVSTIYSIQSKEKIILPTKSKSILGIIPKDEIFNSVGVPIKNQKISVPAKLTISTDSLAEVKIVSCTACPGFGHVYTPGVGTTEFGRSINVLFTNSNSIINDNGDPFTESDIGAKLIAPSIYDAYITSIDDTDPSIAYIKGVQGNDRDIPDAIVLDRVTGLATTISTLVTYPYPVRLSNYDSYVASDYQLSGSKIEIQFINPRASDEYGHFSDFLIGLTNIKPDVTGPDILNGFIVGGATTTILPNSKILYGEHTHSDVGLTEKGVENGETWIPSFPARMTLSTEQRIPAIANPAGGFCSKLTFDIQNPTRILNVQQLSSNPNPDDPNTTGTWIRTTSNLLSSSIDFDGGQVAVLNANGSVTATNTTYVGVTSSYIDNLNTRYNYIQISAPIPGLPNPNDFTILIRPINCTGIFINKSKVYNYDPYPLYFVAKLKDNSKINNISIKETIGDYQRTSAPPLYVLNSTIDTVGGKAITGTPTTNFVGISRLSSPLVDIDNEQELRPFIELDTFYVGANETKIIDMKKTFGFDRKVITPDISNLESTFILARKIDPGDFGTLQLSLNIKEQ